MPGACRATGRGLQPVGLRVKQVGDFKVDTKNAGSGDLKVLVKGPSEYSSHCGGFKDERELLSSVPEVRKTSLRVALIHDETLSSASQHRQQRCGLHVLFICQSSQKVAQTLGLLCYLINTWY